MHFFGDVQIEYLLQYCQRTMVSISGIRFQLNCFVYNVRLPRSYLVTNFIETSVKMHSRIKTDILSEERESIRS